MAGPTETLAEGVRRNDPDRYLCTLFAPSDRRPGLLALLAFNHEVAKIRETVSEPMLGQIRLQWWRESLDGIEAGTPRRHEVVLALAEAMHRHGLPRVLFDRLLDARERDLDDVPFATMSDLEDYVRDTASGLAVLQSAVLGLGEAAQPVAERVAAGFALAGLIRATAHLARQKRMALPEAVAITHGVRPEELFELRDHAGLRDAVGSMADRARALLADVPVDRAARPLLLPAVLARHDLARLARAGHNVFDPTLNTPSPGRVWRLWWATVTRRA